MPDFQNPQQEPGTERRLLLVFVLTFVVILAFQPLLKKYGPQPSAPQPQNQAAQNQGAQTQAATAPSPSLNAGAVSPLKGVTKQASGETE
ncbi:MAG TPA: hypothetical protein VIH54_17150, partial [Chthoniobacterales bacterium]